MTDPSPPWLDALAPRVPLSPDLVTWARTQPDLATAWTTCERVDWLIDLGTALDLDDTSQRALVVAAVSVLRLEAEPTLLRLRPVGYMIAEAWALRCDADALDLLNTRRFDDYRNATIAYVPIALTALLWMQYRTTWPRGIRQLIAVTAIGVIHVVARAWGIARVWLTKRAIRTYRFEQAERDVFRPARAHARLIARRLPQYDRMLLDRFRHDWNRIADFAVPRSSRTGL
jgi:hypothetical protein